MSQHIKYFCRGTCSRESLHEIENFVEDPITGNFAKLKCIKCNEPPFVVSYPKGSPLPSNQSPRVGGVLIDLEDQPTDNHEIVRPPFFFT